MDDLTQLKARVDALEAFIASLKMSAFLPREVETAFSERLGVISATGAGTPTSIATPVTIPVATTTLVVTYKGTTYNLLAQ